MGPTDEAAPAGRGLGAGAAAAHAIRATAQEAAGLVTASEDAVTRPGGATIRLRSGAYFDFAKPEASPISIEDIASALSKLCRFTGHTVRFYSVAEHSVHASYLVPPELAGQALLHDAAEAYLGDVASPLKALLPDYRALEARVEAAVRMRFGLPIWLDGAVKLVDRQMLAVEQDQAMHCDDAWSETAGLAKPDLRLRFWEPVVARAMFLNRADDLGLRVRT